MAITSLVAFRAYVDSLAIPLAAKTAGKGAGGILARAAVREAVAHANKHLNAVLLDNALDLEMAARVSMMRRYLDSVRLTDG